MVLPVEIVEKEDNEEDGYRSDFAKRTDDSFSEIRRDAVSYIQYKDHDLHLIRKNKINTNRPVVPATLYQRLNYIRYVSCTPLKQQMLFFQPTSVLTHIWLHIYRSFFESMPHLYSVIFLSLYAPHQHLFTSKMVPLFWGCSLQIMLSALFSMVIYSSSLILLLDYAILGIFSKTPWGRCGTKTYTERNGKVIECCLTQEFYNMNKKDMQIKVVNRFADFAYKINETYYLPAPLMHYKIRQKLDETSKFFSTRNLFCVYYSILWISAIFFYRQIFKEKLWRVYTALFWIVCFIYAISYVWIEILIYTEGIKSLPIVLMNTTIDFQLKLEFERYGEILTAPPVVHFLYSRSKSEVKPGLDSITITISNILFYVFQAFLNLRLRNYCDGKAGISVQFNNSNSFPLYYLWPMFYESFTLGALFAKTLFVLQFILDYLTFVITYQIMIEVITCEWPKFKWWWAAILFSGSAIIYKEITNENLRRSLYMTFVTASALTEIIAIYWFYPIGRLIEDINFFYYENFVTKIRRTSLLCMPSLFLVGTLLSLKMVTTKSPLRVICLVAFPLLVGFSYKCWWAKKRKKPCKSLFIPLNSWGPQDDDTRTYRKQFDQTKFIDSMSDRNLSRHMLTRAEPPSYRLGLQYDE